MTRVIQFPDRESWLEGRRTMIGSSDVRAIFGQGYSGENKLSVYADKVATEPRRDPKALLKKFRAGHRAERLVLETYADEMEVEVHQHEEPTIYRHSELDFLGSTIDGWTFGETGKEVVEAKFIGHHAVHQWKGVHPPLGHALQVHMQLVCTNWHRAWLVGWTGEESFIFQIDRHEQFRSFLLRELTAFWHDHVLARIPPTVDGSDASAEAIRRLFPVDDGAVIDLGESHGELVSRLDRIKAREKKLEAMRKEAENRLRMAMGEASYGVLPDGRCVSLKLQERRGYFVEPTSFRKLYVHKSIPKEAGGMARPKGRRAPNVAQPTTPSESEYRQWQQQTKNR